ncbi:hypothetical protein FBULB1_4159 [Fusarium bulbicola]|nr:hypothetical protein FBULB1_4159 [Fusarium bulbicola]
MEDTVQSECASYEERYSIRSQADLIWSIERQPSVQLHAYLRQPSRDDPFSVWSTTPIDPSSNLTFRHIEALVNLRITSCVAYIYRSILVLLFQSQALVEPAAQTHQCPSPQAHTADTQLDTSHFLLFLFRFFINCDITTHLTSLHPLPASPSLLPKGLLIPPTFMLLHTMAAADQPQMGEDQKKIAAHPQVRVVGDDILSRSSLTLKEDTSFNDLVRSIYPKHAILTDDMKDDLMSAIFLNWTSKSKGIIVSATKISSPKIEVVGCPARVWADHSDSPSQSPPPRSSSSASPPPTKAGALRFQWKNSAGGFGKASRVKPNGYTIEEAEFGAIENRDAYWERAAFVHNRERAIELGRKRVREFAKAGSQGKDPVIKNDLLPNGFVYPKLARDEQDKYLDRIIQQRKWREEARSSTR